MEITQLLYIDPAATSILLTSLTAIVVAVGASAIIIWRKLKKKVDQTMNKDPNANKEVEDELVITDAEIADETAETAETTETVEAVESAETEKVEEPVEATESETQEIAPRNKAKTKKQK